MVVLFSPTRWRGMAAPRWTGVRPSQVPSGRGVRDALLVLVQQSRFAELAWFVDVLGRPASPTTSEAAAPAQSVARGDAPTSCLGTVPLSAWISAEPRAAILPAHLR